MTTTETQVVEAQRSINYYKRRLATIVHLFREDKLDLLNCNQDKVRKAVEGYRRFEGDQNYDSTLPLTIETFILGDSMI